MMFIIKRVLNINFKNQNNTIFLYRFFGIYRLPDLLDLLKIFL